MFMVVIMWRNFCAQGNQVGIILIASEIKNPVCLGRTQTHPGLQDCHMCISNINKWG